MERPKNNFSLVHNFPPDIWAHVARFLSGEPLVRLKLTGAKHLWRNLKAPNVVKSVNLGQDFQQLKSWPAFLNEFPTLEDLSIFSYSS